MIALDSVSDILEAYQKDRLTNIIEIVNKYLKVSKAELLSTVPCRIQKTLDYSKVGHSIIIIINMRTRDEISIVLFKEKLKLWKSL